MRILFSYILLIVFINGCIPPELKLPSLPRGPKGERGKQGIQGPPGKPGQGLSSKQLESIDLLINDKYEYLVGSTSYSFGFAPTITGFVYLTNHGRLFKLENKNPQTVGKNIELIVRIAEKEDFIAINRIAYGEDIKQVFSATTREGKVYTSNNLKKWSVIQDEIILNN